MKSLSTRLNSGYGNNRSIQRFLSNGTGTGGSPFDWKGYFVQKSLARNSPNPILKSVTPHHSLKGKTVFISGGSRGIGLAIGLRCAKDGANVVIAAKTVDPHPKLEGTIYSAAKECDEAGGSGFAVQCNIQDEESVKTAVDQAVEKYGGIDILINSASAVHIQESETISMKRYDLMHSINGRGTFMVTKYVLPHLKTSNKNPHILTLAPPIHALWEPSWFRNAGTAYTSAKLAMSMQVVGFSAELKDFGIGVNALWPRTTIATAAIKNKLGGETLMNRSRTPDIMSDAAHVILCSSATANTGNFWIDDEVLVSTGVFDLSKYRYNKEVPEHELCPDFFV